jgi:4-aminobutyrate aminotransferase-like enzyme
VINVFCSQISVFGIGHYIPKVKSAIESILRSCNKAYSLALLTSSKATIGMLLRLIICSNILTYSASSVVTVDSFGECSRNF